MEIRSRAQNVKLLVLDVDGVLTSNQLVFNATGEKVKIFNTHDGLGIAAAHKAGLKTAIISGRTSKMVTKRADDLKIGDVIQGSVNKLQSLMMLLDKHQLTLAEVAYVGDDLNDLPVLNVAGFACAVANAVAEVKLTAHYISDKAGGCGAVREIIEYILNSQNRWKQVVDAYRTEGQTENLQ